MKAATRWTLRLALVALPGGAAIAAALWFRRYYRMTTLTERLDATLPPRMAQWARELALAAVDSAPSEVGADRWAFVFAGIVDRESGGGVFLSPRGPEGVGDRGHGHGLGQVDDRPARDDRSDYEQALSKKRLAHIASGDWKDPRKHLRFCALEILRGAFEEFADVADPEERLAAAVASYNAGVDRVRAQLAMGGAVDDVTTPGESGEPNYSSDVLARAGSWRERAAA